jgi:hypothetical protein
VPLRPPQIPHDLTRDRTRAAAVESRLLTARAVAQPDRRDDGYCENVYESTSDTADSWQRPR